MGKVYQPFVEIGLGIFRKGVKLVIIIKPGVIVIIDVCNVTGLYLSGIVLGHAVML
ncbi:hypothetical protein [uncultured Desulfobacter sp.]|uniref:hypothetical protein n=1 Tax=uncultured Desulfobacter sp. TaxID=240139 RepID=UPI0029F4A6BE|nr:hypothetical protein [uncultured Desulfobacter sp.]